MWKYVGYLVALAFVASCATDDGVTPQVCNAGVEGYGCAPSPDAGQGTDVALGTDAEGTDVDADTPMGTDADADTEDVAVGTDVNQGTDAGTADLAPDTVTTDVDSGSTDADTTDTVDPPPVEIPCDATNGVRLEKYGGEMWKDKLLDIVCEFHTTPQGWKCLPLNTDLNATSGPNPIGNKSFPAATPIKSVLSDLYSDSSCKKPMFATKVFNAAGEPWANPKYGFTLGPKGGSVVEEAYDLEVPESSYVKAYFKWDAKNKSPGLCALKFGCADGDKSKVSATDPMYISVYDPKTKGYKCQPDQWAQVQVGSAYAAIMWAKGPATNPKCPSVTGLAVFATKGN